MRWHSILLPVLQTADKRRVVDVLFSLCARIASLGGHQPRCGRVCIDRLRRLSLELRGFPGWPGVPVADAPFPWRVFIEAHVYTFTFLVRREIGRYSQSVSSAPTLCEIKRQVWAALRSCRKQLLSAVLIIWERNTGQEYWIDTYADTWPRIGIARSLDFGWRCDPQKQATRTMQSDCAAE